MRKKMIKSRWVMILISFVFLLFHHLLGYLMEPITTLFRMTASISDRWIENRLPVEVITAVGVFLIWGYFFDRHSRKRLLSLVGFLWGVSAWLMGFAPTLTTFNMSKALAGVGLASHSGIYAFVGDLFKPSNRGKILGLLLLARPLAYMLGLVWSVILVTDIDWRSILILLGAIGFLIALAVHLMFIEPKRGSSEPALIDIHMSGTYQLDWDIAKTALKKPSLLLLYVFMLIGIIPWIVLPNGLLLFLRNELNFNLADIHISFLPTLFGVTLGFPFGGILGDMLFRYTKKGRLIPSLLGLMVACGCLFIAFRMPFNQVQGFLQSILLMGFFMAFCWPNMLAAVMDITLPELRGSAFALVLLFQALSTFASPYLLSYVEGWVGLGPAILWICLTAWMICILISVLMFFYFPKDVEQLRRHMAYRSHLEARFTGDKNR